MKKLLLASGAVLGLLIAGCGAQPTEQAAEETAEKPLAEGQIHCAVMKEGVVNIEDATKKKMFADYEGNRYFFCCAGCPEDFEKDPTKYAQNDHIPIPEAE